MRNQTESSSSSVAERIASRFEDLISSINVDREKSTSKKKLKNATGCKIKKRNGPFTEASEDIITTEKARFVNPSLTRIPRSLETLSSLPDLHKKRQLANSGVNVCSQFPQVKNISFINAKYDTHYSLSNCRSRDASPAGT